MKNYEPTMPGGPDDDQPIQRTARWIGKGLTMAMVGVVLVIVMISFVTWNLPSVASLQDFRPSIVSEVFGDEYIKIGEFFEERRILVPLEQIPPMFVKCFIAAEDAQFFEHKGISFSGILRAFAKNILAGEVRQGGSTITQQVAKQLLLSPERSLIRKMREAILAFKMEGFLSKEKILEIYLNQVYLGQSAYGVAAAAQVYFAKGLSDLTLAEMAMLTGLTRAPSRDNPFSDINRAKEQQRYVLERLLAERYIAQEEHDAARVEAIVLAKSTNLNVKIAPYFVEHVRRYVTEKYGDAQVLRGGLEIFTTLKVEAALAAQKALQRGIEELDRHQGYRGSLAEIPPVERAAYLEKLKKDNGTDPLVSNQTYRALVTEVADDDGLVYVHVGSQTGAIPIEDMTWARKPDPEKLWSSHLIKKPSQALKTGDIVLVKLLDKPPSRKGAKLPTGVAFFSLAQEPLVQGALVALHPVTGAVEVMVGGYDFSKSEFNRVVQARRQPGSAFKAIIYTAALDHGYTPASILVDSPIVYDDPTTDLRWKPKNFGGKFYGDTIFRDCLVESRNVPTIKIVQDIGIDRVIEYAQKMGISSPLARNFSLALGSSGVTPLELVSAYAVLAAGGRKFKEPFFIKKIVDRDGKVLERNLLTDPALEVVEQAALVEQQIARATADEEARVAGQDSTASLPEGYVISPQTAYMMTNLLKQVIHFGTGRRAAGINRPAAGKTGTTNDNHDAWFVGFTPTLVAGVWLGLDDSSSPLGVQEEGGRAASPIWLEFMQKALADTQATDFKLPPGLVFSHIDSKTGRLAGPKTKDALFEVFRQDTEPKEISEDSAVKKTPQQFFLQE